MNVEETLKNIVNFWDIYEYVAGDAERNFDDVKRYLMEECGKAESTARAHISAFKKSEDNIADIYDDDRFVCIDVKKISDLEMEMDEIFGFAKYDYRAEELYTLKESMDEVYKHIEEKQEELDALRDKYENRIRKINKAAWDCKLNGFRTEIRYLKRLLEQPVLVSNDAFVWDAKDFQLREDSYLIAEKEREDLELKRIKKNHDEILVKQQDEWEELLHCYKAKGIKLWERIIFFPLVMLMRWKKSKYQVIAESILFEDIKKKFAREMVEQNWKIVAEFNGKLEPFKIVPERYLSDMQKEIADLEQQISSGQADEGLLGGDENESTKH